MKVDADAFIQNKFLSSENFGPSTLIVTANDKNQIIQIARLLEGQLTATLQATEKDLENFPDLIPILEQKVGRLFINGFPTGAEVCHSMVHGGPFPATTDARSTSIGTGAISRFTRAFCYQGFPQNLLPDELKDDNPLKIRRMVDGVCV